jgi:hypothetical protein
MIAADNDDAYNLTPAFILETVEVAREFVAKQSPGNVTRNNGHDAVIAPKVAAFLAWPQERVKHALAQLAAFEPDEETKEPTPAGRSKIPRKSVAVMRSFYKYEPRTETPSHKHLIAESGVRGVLMWAIRFD